MKNDWTCILQEDIETYPSEGVEVIVSDGKNYDIAYYLMSSEYVWMKVHPLKDTAKKFKEFTPTMWKTFK